MFRIQPSHLIELKRAADERLSNDIQRLLGERFPDSVAEWSSNDLATFVQTSIMDARKHQMNYNTEIAEWTCFCFEHEAVRLGNREQWVIEEITYPNRTGARKIARIRQLIDLPEGGAQ